MTARRSLLSALVLAAGLSLSPARALTVFDPSNYVQNVIQAARALEQINNQISSLANEAQMLVNQARNLQSLPLSTLSQIQSSVQRTQSLIAQAQNIAYDVQRIEAAYAADYGAASASASDAALVATARTRWQNSVGAFEDSLKTQAGVVGNIPSTSAAMASLVEASQSASGALQAAQAGNQLLALQSQQLSDVTALLAAQARADALEQARNAATEAQGREQYRRFSTHSGYTPHDVTMFGE
ncbi:P-type conjugative transfer protein TrbJ [Azospirillum agricola]|uniref:P-type conjugative transfer protein TrbJ n=1 Tax=Azospirillum agricola TaxID=1720247 RepID=UPI000A0F0DE8|nr:P-type conjugative transfer protein TrbJ [Azospirillum agricola]SMH43274.1 P-type conjugative transfer protein TrbJ [Azospirillum lipoferum]